MWPKPTMVSHWEMCSLNLPLIPAGLSLLHWRKVFCLRPNSAAINPPRQQTLKAAAFTWSDSFIPCSLFALVFSPHFSVLPSYTYSFWIFFLFLHLSLFLPCSFKLVASLFHFFPPTHIIVHLVLSSLFFSSHFSLLLLSPHRLRCFCQLLFLISPSLDMYF